MIVAWCPDDGSVRAGPIMAAGEGDRPSECVSLRTDSKFRLLFPLFAIAYIDFRDAHPMCPDDHGVPDNIGAQMFIV